MNKLRLSILSCIAIALTAVGSHTAHAGVVTTIQLSGTSFTNAGLQTAQPGSPALNGSTGGIAYTGLTASGTDSYADLTSASATFKNSSGSTKSLYIIVTSTGYTSPAGAVTVLSSLSGVSSKDTTASSVLTLKSVVGTLNPTGTQTQNFPVTPAGGGFNDNATGNIANLGSPFTITQYIQVTLNTGAILKVVGAETSLSPTPEPTSMALLGIGIVGMAGYGWRRRRTDVTKQEEAAPAV